MLDDGFGNCWEKCNKEDCGLEVVRPGKVQCWCDSLCKTCGNEIVCHPATENSSISGYWCDICMKELNDIPSVL